MIKLGLKEILCHAIAERAAEILQKIKAEVEAKVIEAFPTDKHYCK